MNDSNVTLQSSSGKSPCVVNGKTAVLHGRKYEMLDGVVRKCDNDVMKLPKCELFN